MHNDNTPETDRSDRKNTSHIMSRKKKDKILILDWIRNNENAFFQGKCSSPYDSFCLGSKQRTDESLMVYHNIYNSWSWLGGHADGETDLLSVAVREVKEEAGISNVRSVSERFFPWNP